MILGGPAFAGSDQFAFAYPLITLLPALPILFLPFDFAQAAWLTASLIVLVVGILAASQARDRWLLAAIPLAALAFYPSVRALALGQVAPIVAGCLFAAVLAMRGRADYAAGIALALACIKPQMSFLLVPALLWWAWRSRYPKVVIGFGIAAAAFAIATIVWWPGWIGEWLARLVEYRAYAPQPGPLELLLGPWSLVAIIVLIGAGIYVSAKAKGEAELVQWLVPLTLLAAPNSSVSDQVLLLMPAALVMQESSGRTTALLLGVGVVLPWLWFAFTQINGRESPAMVWFLPMVSLGILLCTWARARWLSRSLS
jgi:hypothetical protein